MNQTFDDYSPCKANRIFLTLYGSMNEVMKVGGENNYNIPQLRCCIGELGNVSNHRCMDVSTAL
jgi:hypothetical protein